MPIATTAAATSAQIHQRVRSLLLDRPASRSSTTGRVGRAAGLLERGDELLGALVAARRVLLQRTQHDRLQRRRDPRLELARRHRRLVDLLDRDRDRRLAVERDLAGQQLVEHDPGRVQVGAAVDRVALGLLGREVLDRADDRAGLGHLRGLARAGDAEVGDLGLALAVDDHVLRLDVAVHDPAPVRVAERAQDLLGERDRDLGRQRPALGHELLQRPPVDQLHRDVRRAVPLRAVEDRDDVRVREPGRGLRLAPEALAELRAPRRSARPSASAPRAGPSTSSSAHQTSAMPPEPSFRCAR